MLHPENSEFQHTQCVLFSALLNSFTYTSKQLQTLDFPYQMNINSWQSNTLTDFSNSQQQSFIQAWKASEKLKKTHLESKKNEELQKFSARKPLEEDGDLERKKNREARRNEQIFPQLSLLIGLNKKRNKVKDINWLRREITLMSLYLFQHSKSSPIAF